MRDLVYVQSGRQSDGQADGLISRPDMHTEVRAMNGICACMLYSGETVQYQCSHTAVP